MEFVSGGWVSSDEASPTYEMIIENMHVGHEFLWREFKYAPIIAWNIDEFGHSAVNADLFA